MMACATIINGATEEDQGPAYHGLMDTLATKAPNQKLAADLKNRMPSVVEALKEEGIREWVRTYNMSEDN